MDTQVPSTPMGTQVDDAMMVDPPTTVQGISRGIRFASDIVASVGDSPSLGTTLLSDELETDQSLISDLSSDNAGGVPSSRKSPSVLRMGRTPAMRQDTRLLLGVKLDPQVKILEQVIGVFQLFLQEAQKVEESVCVVSWRQDNRDVVPAITDPFFPEKLSDFQKYCDGFRTTYPAPDKRWYTSFCINHPSSLSPATLLVDIDETIRSEDWFLIECSVQSDKKVIDIGWFVFSVREYASVEFRDVLADSAGISSRLCALQWQNVKEASKELWAVGVKAAEGSHFQLNRALCKMYSSGSTDWPWGIRMRYVSYSSTLMTRSPAVANLKNIQLQFTQTFKPISLQNLRERLDFSFNTMSNDGTVGTITIREAIMAIPSPKKAKDGTILRIFHGVVDHMDRRLGHRVVLIPYPVEQSGSTLGEMMAHYPYTIMSHFYHPDSVSPLFMSFAIENEAGSSYDPRSDSMRTPDIADLELSMKKDSEVFKFDLSLLEKDQKKRKYDGQLVRRLDEASVGTINDHRSTTAAGTLKSGARPSP